MSVFYADVPRDVVLVQGDDARTFLHSQLAQDINAIAIGAGAQSLLLAPSGHVHSLLHVVRHADTVFTVDVEPGLGEQVIVRLQRFVLRAKVVMRPIDWKVRRFVGTENEQLPQRGTPSWGPLMNAVDVVAAEDQIPTMGERVEEARMDQVRVDQGWPRMLLDIPQGMVPAGTGIVASAVSFTKGCYPGQELVERMDSRGANSPQWLELVPLSDAIAQQVTSRGASLAFQLMSRTSATK